MGKRFNSRTIQYKLWTWIPSVLMMIIIFRFSSATGEQSAGLSLQVTEKIASVVESIGDLNLAPEEELSFIDTLHTIVRKLAHMAEYAILAITIAFPLYIYSFRRWKLALWSEGISILYACFDELHQLFIAERSGHIMDVIIDSLGAAFGIILYFLIIKGARHSEQKMNKI